MQFRAVLLRAANASKRQANRTRIRGKVRLQSLFRAPIRPSNINGNHWAFRHSATMFIVPPGLAKSSYTTPAEFRDHLISACPCIARMTAPRASLHRRRRERQAPQEAPAAMYGIASMRSRIKALPREQHRTPAPHRLGYGTTRRPCPLRPFDGARHADTEGVGRPAPQPLR